MSTTRRLIGLVIAATVVCALPGAAIAKPGAATFSFGQPEAATVGATGCGTNPDGSYTGYAVQTGGTQVGFPN
jgi:hypothetical protein